jgi:hypothetical protein
MAMGKEHMIPSIWKSIMRRRTSQAGNQGKYGPANRASGRDLMTANWAKAATIPPAHQYQGLEKPAAIT